MDQCVTKAFPAGGVGRAVSTPAASGRQTHFGNNLLKIG